MQSISGWLKLDKLLLNIGKTKAIIVHTPQKKILYPNLYLDDTKIEFVNKVNFLGLIIEEHLKWTYHVKLISKKISKTLGIMSKKNCL